MARIALLLAGAGCSASPPGAPASAARAEPGSVAAPASGSAAASASASGSASASPAFGSASASGSAAASASTPASASAPACPLGERGPDGLTPLERGLRDALVEARLDQVIDLGPTAEQSCTAGAPCPGAPLGRTPHVDLAVIAFPEGCPPAGANVLLSPDFPAGRVSAIDPVTQSITGVRFRRWDPRRWDGAARPRADADDIVPGATGVDFDLPYPASLFKLLVAVQVLRLVDRGALRLDQRVHHDGAARALRAWLDDMITRSDNVSARALLRVLHRVGEANSMNGVFAGLGLPTLQVHGTSPVTGGEWHPGQIHMGAWDTARLLWLLDPDAPPPAWPADPGILRPASRALLSRLLREQAFHEALSTSALCGDARVPRGIPALMPTRWVAADGSVDVDELRRSADARPCIAAAEVTFAHKTGLTFNYGSDAGIVVGLPGRGRRHYIIALVSNLGYRYTDADRAGGPLPCLAEGLCYTRRIPALGSRLDAMMKAWLE